MADRVIKVLTPADSFDLVTLAELKTAAGLDPTDTSMDPQLEMYISNYSDAVATLCNRVFAYEEVAEIWRCTNVDLTNGMKRLFVSHWPIDLTAELTLESPTGTALDPTTYVVEQRSGKIEMLSTWAEPITVTYSGGYHLPDEAPPALKQAVGIAVRDAQAMAQRMATGGSGIRSLTHRENRVQFFDPLAVLSKTTSGATGGGFVPPAVYALLSRYTRLEV